MHVHRARLRADEILRGLGPVPVLLERHEAIKEHKAIGVRFGMSGNGCKRMENRI